MISPTKNLVFARKLAPEEQEINGIIITTQQHRDDRYLVMYVGPDTRDVSVGDTVYIRPNAESTIVKHDGDTLRVLKEENIYAVEVDE
jgi:co-chaperonin GroES (HSP10)